MECDQIQISKYHLKNMLLEFRTLLLESDILSYTIKLMPISVLILTFSTSVTYECETRTALFHQISLRNVCNSFVCYVKTNQKTEGYEEEVNFYTYSENQLAQKHVMLSGLLCVWKWQNVAWCKSAGCSEERSGSIFMIDPDNKLSHFSRLKSQSQP
jgi:hypothetical protein